MSKRSIIPVAVMTCILAVTAAWALQEPPPRGERDAKRYKVTPWPADTAGRDFHEHVEQHLNDMAAQGWEFHSAMVGQPARVMVFRRP